MNLKSTYENISKARSFVMGIAILWIVWYHSQIELVIPGVGFVKLIGYAGVDVFLFLSGIGIYQSLCKNAELLPFYKRRISRIFQTYIPVFLIWFLCRVIYDYKFAPDNFPGVFETVKGFLGNIFMLGWGNGLHYQFNWYVQTIMWFYLVSPIIFALLRACSGSLKRYFLFFIGLVLLQIVFMNFFQTLMAVSRLFVYILGMLASQLYNEGKMTRLGGFLPVMCIGFVLLYYSLHIWKMHLWTFGLWWYPIILIVPGFVILLALIYSLLQKIKVGVGVCNFVSIFGKASLEICLIQTAIFEFVTDIIRVDTNFKWICLSVLTIVLGLLYRGCLDYMQKK